MWVICCTTPPNEQSIFGGWNDIGYSTNTYNANRYCMPTANPALFIKLYVKLNIMVLTDVRQR